MLRTYEVHIHTYGAWSSILFLSQGPGPVPVLPHPLLIYSAELAIVPLHLGPTNSAPEKNHSAGSLVSLLGGAGILGPRLPPFSSEICSHITPWAGLQRCLGFRGFAGLGREAVSLRFGRVPTCFPNTHGWSSLRRLAHNSPHTLCTTREVPWPPVFS